MHSLIFAVPPFLRFFQQPRGKRIDALAGARGYRKYLCVRVPAQDIAAALFKVKIEIRHDVYLVDYHCITYRKHQRVFQRLIVSLRNGQYHRVLHGARIELGWTNKIADIFKYRKVDIIRAKSGESLTRHVRIKMAHTAGMQLYHLRAGAFDGARVAEDCGVDALNITVCTYASVEYMCATPMMPSGWNEFPTAVIKNSVNIPVMAVGRFNNLLVAADCLEAGRADLICFGRTSLAAPELPNKLAEDRLDEQIPCIGCTQSCVSALTNPARGFKASCLINPVTGHEFEYDLTPVAPEKAKKVLVVGGGPGGLIAAMTAAQRGHKVTLCEASGKFGGKFRLASIPPCKHEIAAGLKYYIHMCEKRGVDMRLNCEVDEQFIRDLAPDAIILATGSLVAKPPIPGIDNEKFLTVADILDGKVLPGRNVLIAGGGLTGCETADFLCEHNRVVSVMEMAPVIAADAEATPRRFLMQRLNKWSHALDFYGPALSVYTGAKIKQFYEDGVAYEMGGEVKELHGFDSIILSLGVKSYNPLEEVAKSLCGEVYVVGDAEAAGNANHATDTGLAAALKL